MSTFSQFFPRSGGNAVSNIPARVQIVDGGSGLSCICIQCPSPSPLSDRQVQQGGVGGYIYDLHYDLTPKVTCTIVVGAGGSSYNITSDSTAPNSSPIGCDGCWLDLDNTGTIFICSRLGKFGERSSFGGTFYTSCGTPFCLQTLQCTNPGPPCDNYDARWAQYYDEPSPSRSANYNVSGCGEFCNIPYVDVEVIRNEAPNNKYNTYPFEADLAKTFDWGNGCENKGSCRPPAPFCDCLVNQVYCICSHWWINKLTCNTYTYSLNPSSPGKYTYLNGACVPNAFGASFIGTRNYTFGHVGIPCSCGTRSTGDQTDKYDNLNKFLSEGSECVVCYQPADSGSTLCVYAMCGPCTPVTETPYTRRCSTPNSNAGPSIFSGYSVVDTRVIENCSPTSPRNYGHGIGLRGKSSLKGYVSDITGELREYGAGGRGRFSNIAAGPNIPICQYCWFNAPVPIQCTPWSMFCGSGGGAPSACKAPATSGCPSSCAYCIAGEYIYSGGCPGSVIIQYPDEYAAATVSSPNVCDCSPNTPGFRTYAFYEPGSIILP